MLGLKHADLSVEDGSLQIVPRADNPNGARAKTRNPYVIPVLPEVMHLYTDYLIEDLGALEADSLPDFVFVNLCGEERKHRHVMRRARQPVHLSIPFVKENGTPPP